MISWKSEVVENLAKEFDEMYIVVLSTLIFKYLQVHHKINFVDTDFSELHALEYNPIISQTPLLHTTILLTDFLKHAPQWLI